MHTIGVWLREKNSQKTVFILSPALSLTKPYMYCMYSVCQNHHHRHNIRITIRYILWCDKIEKGVEDTRIAQMEINFVTSELDVRSFGAFKRAKESVNLSRSFQEIS